MNWNNEVWANKISLQKSENLSSIKYKVAKTSKSARIEWEFLAFFKSLINILELSHVTKLCKKYLNQYYPLYALFHFRMQCLSHQSLNNLFPLDFVRSKFSLCHSFSKKSTLFTRKPTKYFKNLQWNSSAFQEFLCRFQVPFPFLSQLPSHHNLLKNAKTTIPCNRAPS